MPKDMPVTQGLRQRLLVKGMMVLEAVLEIQTIANSRLISIARASQATKLTLGPNPAHQDLAAEPRAQEKVDKPGKEPPLLPYSDQTCREYLPIYYSQPWAWLWRADTTRSGAAGVKQGAWVLGEQLLV